MAPRAYWKGHLKLSLVSCPIAVNPATTSSERVSFRQINKKTGNRLRQQPRTLQRLADGVHVQDGERHHHQRGHGQQAEHEEHADLRQPGERVVEALQVQLVGQHPLPEHHAGEVDGIADHHRQDVATLIGV